MRRPLPIGRLLFLGVVGTTAFAARAYGQQPESIREVPDGILIDFQNADLQLVITALAEAGGLNLAHGELPSRRVTLRMQQPVPRENIRSLLISLAQSNGLTAVENNGFIRLEAAGPGAPGPGAQQDSTSQPEVRLFVYRLKHARAGKLAATLQAIFGGASQSKPAAQASSLSDNLSAARLHPADSAAPGPLRVEATLVPTTGSLPGQLSGPVQIVPDEATNSLLVRAETPDWDILQEAIQALDLRPLQVLIEVLILEVRRTREFGLAIAGSVADSKSDPRVRGTIPGESSGDVLLELLKAGTVDLHATLSLLSSRGDVHIVSRPVILAQNNQEAKILIGSERPFVQVFRSLPTDAGVRDQVVQYRDVGTKLTIVPTINNDGYVNLQILQEVSTATAETQFGAPVISTREASTQLFVHNGQTAVIGGLIDRQQEKTRSGIPILMELPVLGGLFGSTHEVTTRSELFLFLTPHIITTDTDVDDARERVKKLRSIGRDSVPDAILMPGAPDVEP